MQLIDKLVHPVLREIVGSRLKNLLPAEQTSHTEFSQPFHHEPL